MAVLISLPRESDIPAMWEIERDVMTISETPHVWQEDDYNRYKDAILNGMALVAHDDNGVVLGSLSYHYAGNSPSRRRQWLFGISVSRYAQGQGVGRKLIERLIDLGKENGIGKIALRVMATNEKAIAFYRHLGFEQEAYFKREFWLDDQWIDDYQFAVYLD